MKIPHSVFALFSLLAVISAGGPVLLYTGAIDVYVALAVTVLPALPVLVALAKEEIRGRRARRAQKEQLGKLLAGRKIRIWWGLFSLIFGAIMGVFSWIATDSLFFGSVVFLQVTLIIPFILYEEWLILKIRTHYAALELPTNAAVEEIERAYKTLGMKHHPYRNRDNAAVAAKRFKKIDAAYAFLSYDKKNAAASH